MPMKPKPLPAFAVLREVFDYDPQTGILRNRLSRTSRRAGTASGHKTVQRYLQVYACGRLLTAHRVAWLLHYGVEPGGFIDHINGDPADNRIENLRECSHSQNMMNSKLRSHNKSGVAGVHKRNDNGKWRAYISADNRRTNLGQFDSFEEACAARDLASANMHGEFARAS